jgi:DNA-binding transcriptional LysR family regulator
VQSSDIYSLRLLAAMGQGIAFVPDNGMALPGDPTGHLIPVLDDLVGRPSSLRLLVPAPLIELPKVRVAMDLLRGFMGSVTPEPSRG